MTPADLAEAYARTCVIVPAFNEVSSIEKVVLSVFEHMPGATVVVVDDGSSDGTSLRAASAGATVLTLSANLGIGGAVQTGYMFALSRDFLFAVQIDGDGQHDPVEAYRLFEQLVSGECDIVIGSRWLGRGDYIAPRNRRFGMMFLQSIVSWRAGSRFTDTTSGFRALNRRAITLFARHYPRDYPEVESILVAHNHGLVVKEVPTSMKSREYGRSSIRGLQTLYFMIRITISLIVGAVEGEEA